MPNLAFRRLGRGLLALVVATQAVFGGLISPATAHAAVPIQLTEFAPSSGQVEIYNSSNAPQTLDGYVLKLGSQSYTIPVGSGTVINPTSYQVFTVGVVSANQSTLSLTASVTSQDGVSSDSLSVGLSHVIPAPDAPLAVALVNGEWRSNLPPTPGQPNDLVGISLPDQPASLTVSSDNIISAAEKANVLATAKLSSFASGVFESVMPFVITDGGTVKTLGVTQANGTEVSLNWNLAGLASGPATAGFFVQSGSGARSQIIRTNITIEGDTAGPTATLTVKPTLTVSNSVTITLANIADDVSSPANIQVAFSNDGTNWGSATNTQGQPNGLSLPATNLPLAGVSWTLTPGSGEKTVSARLTDEAGNQTVLTKSVELDDRLTPPGTISLAPGSTTPEIHPFASGADDVVINNLSIKSDSAVTLTASRYGDNPYPSAPRPEGYTATAQFINLRLDPSASVNFPVTIRIYFTEANSKLAGAMFYDYASGSWKLYAGSEGTSTVVQSNARPGFAGYVEIQANHLTPIALAAKTEVLAPTNLTAVSGNGQVTLKWDARSSASSYFVIYHAVGSTAQTQTNDITGTETTITGLTNGTRYEFQVFGRDNFGNISADHATAITAPVAPAPAPAPAAPAAPVKPVAAKKRVAVQTEAQRQAGAAQASAIDALKTVEKNIDKTVTIFRTSADNTEIKQRLMNELSLTDSQADAILNLRQAVINKNGGPFASDADEKAALLTEIKARLNEPASAAELLPSPTPTPTETPSPSPSPAPAEEPETTPSRTPWIVLGILIALAAAATAGYFYWFREEDEDEGPPKPPPPPRPSGNGGVKTTVRGPGEKPTPPPPPPAKPAEKPAPPPPPAPKPKEEEPPKTPPAAPPPRW